jgi:hypothetical protein
MSIETRICCLVKKTGVKKSRWTVPLSNLWDTNSGIQHKVDHHPHNGFWDSKLTYIDYLNKKIIIYSWLKMRCAIYQLLKNPL